MIGRFVFGAALALAALQVQPVTATEPMSGCFVGVGAGYAFGNNSTTDAPFREGPLAGQSVSWNTFGGDPEVIDTQASGMTGSVEVGCDLLQTGNAPFFLGGVLDLGVANLAFEGESSINSDTQISLEADWLASARMRLGMATDNALFYLTGGLAVANINARAYDVETSPTFGLMDVSGGGITPGLVIGAGTEWRLAEQWSVSLDYLHYDFGNVTATGAAEDPVEAFPRFQNDLTVDVVRVGLKWRL